MISSSLPMFKPLCLYSSECAYSIPQINHHASTKTSSNTPRRCHWNYFCKIRDSQTHKFDAVHCQIRDSGSWGRETPQRNLKDGDANIVHGIGISRFLRGKNYLVTGATGLVAKVFIEKMLRTSPDVGQIFLLIKAKDKEAALNRLKTEIVDCLVFKRLQEVHGKQYEAFMMSKLVAVPGNVCESDLGMDALTANLIANKVHVIVNSAGNTNFDERYDVALNVNSRGPSRLLTFAKTCKKICLFLHISTAYVNDGIEGIIKETPLYMEKSIAREMETPENQVSVPIPNIYKEMKLAATLMESANDDEAAQGMKVLGLQRAKIHGWANVYSFTKAMGEMLITCTKCDIPIAIVRPSVIESTYKEPFPGWIEGCRMLDPFILSYGKGLLSGVFGDPQVVLDVVPVDMVVNAAIAAMAKHGSCGNPNLIVYQVGSSVVNPVSLGDFCGYVYDHFKCYPLLDSKGNEIGISTVKFFSSIDDFSSYILSEMTKKTGMMKATTLKPKPYANLPMQCKKRAQHFIHMAKMCETYAFYKGRFDIGNTQKLMEEMSKEEIRMFWFDIGSMNWEEYICSIHVPSLRKHVLKRQLVSAN